MGKNLFFPIFLLATFVYQANAAIIESRGWLETFYVTWSKEPCAAKYNVYYRATGASAWTKIDDQLVREYNDHFRADVLGLKAGTYEARVVLVNGGTELNTPAPMTVTNIQVSAHERTGFAFMDGVVPGAYKADGTLKDNANVIYITDQNKNTVSFAVKTASNGGTTASTGLLNIMKSIEKGYEDRPLAFRFIGKVTDTGFTLDGGDIPVKDNCKVTANCYITFEGVGNDATLYGLGFKTTRAAKLEIRNLGIMLTNSTEIDNVGINSASEHIWVHNNDMFYGNPGSDADQVKGDGTTDVKKSTNITISYNHYWDNGKVHLLGNGGETPGYVTYHHNWYDHSDSRHPRVRQHYVHVYNNYYDGVHTYGIGSTTASSIFSERNYFRNTNRPMTISMQGSDAGTFSNEDGGMIKAFNNFIDTDSKKKYTPWSSSNNVEFDAYEVNNAADQVPATVKAKKGGATYKNDILSGYPVYTSQNDSAAIRNQVKTYAGRNWGGDFIFTFNNSIDDGSSSVNTALKSQLQSYVSKLIKIQDTGTGGSVSCPITSSSSTTPSSSSVAPSSSSRAISSSSSVVVPSSSSASLCTEAEKFWNFSDLAFIEALPAGSNNIANNYTVNGLSIVYGNNTMSYTENSKSIDGYDFDYRFQFGGSGSTTNRALKFEVSGKSDVIVYGIASSSDATRTLALHDGTRELQAIDFPGNAISKGIYSYAGEAATVYLYSKNSGINLYGVRLLSCNPLPTKVLPNPVQGNALLATSNAISLQVVSNASVEIFDLKGNLVRSLKFDKGNHFISLDDLPQGLYFIRAKSGGWQKTLKMPAVKK
jgi:pectate lyase